MSKFIIYLLHNDLSNRIYIGKSCSGLKRPKTYRSAAYRKRWAHLPVIRWLKKYDDYNIAVLEEHESADSLPSAEMFYIAYFKSIGTQLLNCTDGGDGMTNPSPETREKLSIASKLRYPGQAAKLRDGQHPASDETKKKISLSKLGKPRSKELRRKLSIAKTGTRHTPETRDKISKIVKARGITEEHRKAISAGKIAAAETRRLFPRFRINLLSVSK